MRVSLDGPETDFEPLCVLIKTEFTAHLPEMETNSPSPILHVAAVSTQWKQQKKSWLQGRIYV